MNMLKRLKDRIQRKLVTDMLEETMLMQHLDRKITPKRFFRLMRIRIALITKRTKKKSNESKHGA